jgi:polyvinyl alcohol dehydrogenase (cytochrome)
MAVRRRWAVLALALLAAACGRHEAPKPDPAAQERAEQDPARLYAGRCASCHEGAQAIVPYGKAVFKRMTPQAVMATMDGVMAQQARTLSDRQRTVLAEFLTGRKLGDPPASPAPPACAEWQNRYDMNRPPSVAGWGMTPGNTRMIGGSAARLAAADVPRLRVKWAFAFPGAVRARVQPTVAGGSVYVGSEDGTVYALDEDSGCVRWQFKADAEIRTAVAVSPWPSGDWTAAPSVYFGDEAGQAYRLDARTGQLAWKVRVDNHPDAAVTGTPVLYDGRLYVPVAATEWAAAADPDYECCTFRGGVTALDAATGARVWKSWAIDHDTRLTGDTNAAGSPTWSPAGAPVWGSPAIDAARKRLYIATDSAYALPAPAASDAVIALDLETGKPVWRYQATGGDAWNLSCATVSKVNCPRRYGLGAGFAAPPMLLRLPGGRELVLAGQKSGDVHALDAQTGRLVWRQRLGRGGFGGGIRGGMASDGAALYVPVADSAFLTQGGGQPRPGLFALDLASGRPLWFAPGGGAGLSAAVTAIPGVVLAGGHDGVLRAYDAASGGVIWSLDTTPAVPTVSGETAHGGSIDGGGPVVADGKVFVTSGSLDGGRAPGNVLLALEPAREWQPRPDTGPEGAHAEP